ncbi:MAG: AMP-binding protein [Deltaproteobacteria bacterium]|nr:AMP-binding protein [Deltaproteobacteria bacterium]
MIPCPVAHAPADRAAVVVDGVVFSYGQLHAMACAHTDSLRARGLSGLRVAVRAPNSVELIALHVAAARTETLLIPLNLRLTDTEQDAQAARLRAVATIDASIHEPTTTTTTKTSRFTMSLAAETVILTSGTTGSAKGARLPLSCFSASAQASSSVLRATQDDVWLLCLPLFHVGALAMMWRSLFLGSTVRLLPASDVDGIAFLLAAGAITQASFVSATLEAVLKAMPRSASRLTSVLVGGGPVAPELLTRAQSRGVPALWTWGLTEAASQVATARTAGRACGHALPGNRLRVVDDDRREVRVGDIGEIEVRGPTIFRGYLDDDDATAAALPGDGFLRTRDLGFVDDDGALSVVARRSDLIVSGGENLYPAMIERVLQRCRAVVDVAVVPVADEQWGQRPAALLVLRPGGDVAEVRAFAASELSRLSRPDRFVVVDALPKNALGKLERHRLAALIP